MMTLIKLPAYLVVSLILAAINLAPLSPFELKIIAGLFYLLFYSLVIGNWLLIKNGWLAKFLFGLLILLMTAGLIATAGFYLWFLNWQIYFLTIVIIPLLLIPIIYKYPLVIEVNQWQINLDIRRLILAVAYLVTSGVGFFLLFTNQTSEAIRSPWQILPQEIFLLYFLATFFLFIFLLISKSSFNLFLIIIHYLLTFSVAAIIYQIGFDYDPFIHRKNVEIILASGTLLPKPFYYIAQYGLIIFIKNLLNLSVALIDKWLIPLLAAVYLPVFSYYAFKDNFNLKINYLYLTILSLLIFPLTFFTTTTPQALATLTFVLTIIFTIYYIIFPKTPLWPLFIMTLFTLAVHPLAGLPLIFGVMLIILFFKLRKKLRLAKILHQGILWEVFVLGCLALPVAFLINSKTLSQLKVGFNFNWLVSSADLFLKRLDIFYRPFINIYDFIYDYANNIFIFFIILIILSLWFLKKQKQIKDYAVYLLIFLMIFINYYLLKTSIEFFTLVSYERLNYPLRVLQLSLLSLAPLVIIAGYLFFQKLFKQQLLIIILVGLLISLGITASFYLAYPRVDQISEDHGYSTSLTDIKTVNFIEQIQNNLPYIVLASQPVSAAAIKELGYKYYYNNLFFYPVPTGEKLYQLFEEVVYSKEKTTDVIATARYLTGVSDVYLVINSYWFDAEKKIIEEKETADKWYAIDGKNFIFKYEN